MKFQLALFALSSGAAAVAVRQNQNPIVCAPVAASCQNLPVTWNKVCSSLIKAQSRTITSCRRPQGTIVISETDFPTVTSTTTIQAKTTTTTVTSTSTIRGPTVTRPPTTLPTTTTTTTIVTSTSSFATTTTTTTTETSTSVTSTTTTQVNYDQTQVPWVQQSCAVVDKRGLMEAIQDYFKRQEYVDINGYQQYVEEREEAGRFVDGHHRRADPVFPTECSCFLTKVMLDVQPGTTTTTILKPSTTTTTKILGGTAPTQTNTFTVSKTTSLAGATIPARTLYSTSTSTVVSTTWTSTTRISTSITTWSTATTSVSTSITTSTQTYTQTLAPCDPGQWGRTTIPGKPSNARVVQGYSRPAWPQNANNEQQCCSDCFLNPYCVYWAMPTDGTQCKFFIVNDDNYECATDQCPRGYPVLELNQVNDGWVYHPGNCGNKWRVAVTTSDA